MGLEVGRHMLQTMKLTASEARTIIDAVAAAGAHQGIHLSIAVVDAGAALMAFEQVDGASPTTAEIAFLKARSSAASGLSTAFFAEVLAKTSELAGPTAFLGRWRRCPGSAGVCIGAVGASWGTALQDAEAVECGLARPRWVS
jgi:glc operon protein GlcG